MAKASGGPKIPVQFCEMGAKEANERDGGALLRMLAEANMTQAELARALSAIESSPVSSDVIGNMVRGVTRITKERKILIASILGIPASVIWPDDLPRVTINGEALRPPALRSVIAEPTAHIKVVGPIGAGTPPTLGSDHDVLLSVPIEFAGENHSGLVVDGDSMMPYIHPGDVLIFEDSVNPRPGQVVCARLKSDPIPIVKKLVFDGQGMRLRSYNPTHSDLPADGAEMVGYLIGIVGNRFRIGPVSGGLDETDITRELSARLP